MTDLELITHLAEKVLGWEAKGADDWGMRSWAGPDKWRHYYERTGEGWNPLASIADAFEVQAAIPGDARDAYVGYLECECVRGGFDEDSVADQWAVITATPRQRCMAAYEATK